MDIPTNEPVFDGVHINYEKKSIYDYNNLTRLAAIFYYMISNVARYESPDDVYFRFVNIGQDLFVLFQEHFRFIFFMYFKSRFIADIKINFIDIKDSIQTSPIICSIRVGQLFVFYSSKLLNEMLNKTMTCFCLYNNAISFNEEEECDDKLNELASRLLLERKKQFECGTAINTHSKHVDVNSLECLFEPTPHSKPITFDFNSYLSHDQGITYQKTQENLIDIYSGKYSSHLFFLHTVYYIFETAINKLLFESVCRKKLEGVNKPEIPTVTIRFSSQIKARDQYSWGNLGKIINKNGV